MHKIKITELIKGLYGNLKYIGMFLSFKTFMVCRIETRMPITAVAGMNGIVKLVDTMHFLRNNSIQNQPRT